MHKYSLPSWLQQLSQSHLNALTSGDHTIPLHSIWRSFDWQKVACVSQEPISLDDSMQTQLQEAIDNHRLPDYTLFVFVNGQFMHEYSDALDSNVWTWHDHESLADDQSILSQRLKQPLRDWAQFHLAYVQSGLMITVSGQQKKRLQILHLQVPRSEGFCGVRHSIEVDGGSELDLVEMHVSLAEEEHLNFVVNHIDLKEKAVCRHNRVYTSNNTHRYMVHDEVIQAESSSLKAGRFSLIDGKVTDALWADLQDANAAIDVRGVYWAQAKSAIDQYAQINHQAPHGQSRQIYRGIASGHAKLDLHSRVFIGHDADQVDADQTGKHLLLSPQAEINTKPELEVYTEEVRCTHGACVGQIDEDALFYCQSRGMDFKTAQQLLLVSHVDGVIQDLESESLSVWLQSAYTRAIMEVVAS